MTYYEINATLVTADPEQAMRVSEAINRVATGFGLEGVDAAVSIDSHDDDYIDDDQLADQALTTDDE